MEADATPLLPRTLPDSNFTALWGEYTASMRAALAARVAALHPPAAAHHPHHAHHAGGGEGAREGGARGVDELLLRCSPNPKP